MAMKYLQEGREDAVQTTVKEQEARFIIIIAGEIPFFCVPQARNGIGEQGRKNNH